MIDTAGDYIDYRYLVPEGEPNAKLLHAAARYRALMRKGAREAGPALYGPSRIFVSRPDGETYVAPLDTPFHDDRLGWLRPLGAFVYPPPTYKGCPIDWKPTLDPTETRPCEAPPSKPCDGDAADDNGGPRP